MTSKQKWWAIGLVVVLGCGGAVLAHMAHRTSSAVATDRKGAPLSCIKDLTLGGMHTCVLFHNGRAHCFGSYLTAGPGYQDAAPDRDPVKTGERFASIAAGSRDTCGLNRKDGTIWCWGDHTGALYDQGEARLPVEFESLGEANTSLGLGTDRVCVLKDDASIWCQRFVREPPEKVLEGVDKLYVRNHFGCAKMKDGQVQCWGNNDSGQLGRGSRTRMTGGRWTHPPAPVSKLRDPLQELRLAAVSACGLTLGNDVWCWGSADYSLFADNRYWKGDTSGDELAQTVPMKLSLGIRFRDFVLGTATACVLAEDRSVWCWGGAGASDLLAEPSVTFKRREALVSLEPRPRKLEPLGEDNARIWAGGAHYCVQKLDQSLWCWGANFYGQVRREFPKYKYEAPLTRMPVVCPPP